MKTNKIVPALWFCNNTGKLSPVVAYYKAVFGDLLEEGVIMPLGETPSGYTEMSGVTIMGQKYSFMSTENEHHRFNDSMALIINCTDQQEIDKYWDYFSSEGEEVQCGWCIDKFGLRWQIIPENLGELMSRPNSWEVMMAQKKIIIAEYLK